MNRRKLLNRLYFDDYFAIDDQIRPETQVDLFAVIFDRNRLLSFYIQIRLSKFVGEKILIDRLDQSRSEGAMNRYRLADDFLCNEVFLIPGSAHSRKLSRLGTRDRTALQQMKSKSAHALSRCSRRSRRSNLEPDRTFEVCTTC